MTDDQRGDDTMNAIYCTDENTYFATPTGLWDITMYDAPVRVDAIPADARIVTDAEALDMGVEIPAECIADRVRP